jgi:hypothetical protein
VTTGSDPGSLIDAGLLAFAQKLLTILDQGLTTATYKYAVLLGLMDLSLERTSRQGSAPTSVTTAQLADKVIELYWPQCVVHTEETGVLRQNSKGQAEIVRWIGDFRRRSNVAGTFSVRQARLADPTDYASLRSKVEFKLVEMPLPRLQRIGDQVDEFLYRVAFQHPEREVKKPSDLHDPTFDNRILFVGEAAEHLVALSPMLRPFIQREWTSLVARFNRFDESELEKFLFGRSRTPTGSLKRGLREIQHGRCFYCDDPIHAPEVDHFVPWARFADDGLDNLVLVDRGCNAAKRAHLAATEHVERWSVRFRPESPGSRNLAALAKEEGWERDSSRTLGAARGVYLHLPPGSRLWLLGERFEPADLRRIGSALSGA